MSIINERLTFAIVSHPDAGKTTITEKLLLFGGAIRSAGTVKGGATSSDFMAMERERGISISTSVMAFDYKNRRINLLDTPGHADFGEDTYRTLTAVDSALMMIDGVKGVEERTRQLCEICRMRHTPLVTFINKMDRDGMDPFELLDQVERELRVYARPFSWPVGQGRDFKGVYSLTEKRVIFFDSHGLQDRSEAIDDLSDAKLDALVGGYLANKLREDVALINEIYDPFDRADYLDGLITPVLFGSALNNFGVRELLDAITALAPSPLARETESRIVEPTEPKFSGFVFKIHANLDPKHRDRVAFLRVCSGVFERNKLYMHPRSGKNYRTATPVSFMAQDRESIDKAYPGDVLGLHDTGMFRVGDALTEGEDLRFKGIPAFAPTMFRKVANKDPMKSKQFNRGLNELSEEGVIQVFTRVITKERLVGAVGALQLEVTQYRLEHEYGARTLFEGSDYNVAAWVRGDNRAAWEKFLAACENRLAMDSKERFVFMAPSRWFLEQTAAEHPLITFSPTNGE